IGVNNQYRGRPPDEYREQFRVLLERAILLGDKDARRVLVVSIPDWGTTPFAHDARRDPRQIAAQIDAFNAAAREESEAHRVRFVDITGISRDPRSHYQFVADGLHPSVAQYTRWVDAMEPIAAEILER
ncbi:MAG: GDSL-type esterase/lipase family protein, partial [Rhodanobacteraceae bacterium]